MTFIYTAVNTKQKRGYNRIVKVWQLIDNKPFFIDSEYINTSGYKGDYATACKIIADKLGLELTANGYYLADEKIKIIELS